MTTRTAELLMAIAMLMVSLSLMWTIRSEELIVGWIEGRGPGAGMWPFWLAVGMALAALWTLVRWFQGATPESRNESPYIDPDHFGLVAASFVGLTLMVFLVGIVGTYIAVPLFLGAYMRLVGKHGWGVVAAMMIGAPIFLYFLFEWQLSVYLPKGLPMFENGFLWIDDFRWRYLM